MSCKKADAFLKKAGIAVRETADATKDPHSKKDALALAKKQSTVIAGRGKKYEKYPMRGDYDQAELTKKMIGPTGKLRAPTIIVGKTMLAGWCEPAWKEFFG